jgi:peptide/nickel transport system substrate-binding protein
LTRKTVKTILAIGLIICLFSLAILSACAQPQPTSTTGPAPTTAKPAGPKYGGTLHLSLNRDATQIGYPPRMMGYQDYCTSRQCIETLVRYDKAGKEIPWLAESWKIDPSAKTIILNLKKGVKFHDGTDFNAAAVKWNLERYVNFSVRPEVNKGTTVDVVDDYTVKVNMPVWDNTQFGFLVSMASAGNIVSPTAFQKAPGATEKDREDWMSNNPVGTGPFKFVSWSKTAKQVYTKFDGYWQKGKPYLDGIQWDIIADQLVASASMQAKEVDAIFYILPNSAKELEAAGYKLLPIIDGWILAKALVPDSANPKSPFANVKVRQAMSYAIDNKAIADSLYMGKYASPVQQIASPNSDLKAPDFKGYPFDPAKAKQLVTEAGFPNGFKTILYVQPDQSDIAVVTACQAMLAKAGINVEIAVTEVPKFMQIQSNTVGWEGLVYSYPRIDPDPVLTFSRTFGPTAQQFQKSMLQPEDVVKAIADAKVAPDREAAKKIAWDLQKLCMEKYCLLTPVVGTYNMAIKQPYLKDDRMFEVLTHQWYPEDAWLDK